MNLTHDTVFHLPPRLHAERRNGTTLLIDPEGPNWLATDDRGARVLRSFDAGHTFAQVVDAYGREHGLGWAEAWLHVDTIARDALRQGMLAAEPRQPARWPGREAFLAGRELTELWLHTNNSCNLRCTHCLVSSGPDGDRGLPTDLLLDVIEQARRLGTRRFYFTGGEPLVRRDFPRLARAALADPEAELAVLTNGILLHGRRLKALGRFDRDRLRLQISLDGASAETNDPIRGPGTFDAICRGIRNAVEVGFRVTVTTAITQANAEDVPAVTRLAAQLGAEAHHLLWLHKRGRADGGPDHTPPVEQVIDVVRLARAAGREAGIPVDNHESLKRRLNAPPGVKRDLSNACVNSLCVFSDGTVYPSAAMAGVPELRCGNVRERSLEEIWRESPVCRDFRAATVEEKEICRTCPLEFLCGGGDIEHAYFYGGSIRAHDPYCELHRAMIHDALFEWAEERRGVHANGDAGFKTPVALAFMGENAIDCATGEEPPAVLTSHSECVLSFELDGARARVREFYGEAAETPQPELCCPTRPDPEAIAHIPEEVVERFYGCGSPIELAGVREGETAVDLGSGAGIDVFLAARLVGPAGRAIGVDMTEEMLEVARAARPRVAERLGYDVAEFRHGYLEEVPVEEGTADLVTSNCVINLSPDKKRVFREMWRILKDGGRIVVSDIVSDRAVPTHQRRDPRLWGECISGALTEEEFLAWLERAGFYGLQVLRRSFWKEVEGYRFYSLTVRGYRLAKRAGCVFRGQHAVYVGPYKGVADEEGHFFPRGVPVEVCTDTAWKLSRPPYAGSFVVSEGEAGEEFACCAPGEDGVGCC